MPEPSFVPLRGHRERDPAEMLERARRFAEHVATRRTVRQFSARDVPQEVIDECLRAAGTSPSGANMQPWHFVVIRDPQVKRTIREAAEAEEREFYASRAPKEWLEALAAIGTDEHKPFLEEAPVLIAVFGRRYEERPDGRRVLHYYVTESVGIATGILVTALHDAGLVSLTHTPSPMKFLNRILGRPASEKPFLLLVTGYPAAGARVPDIGRKALDEIRTVV